MKIPMKHFISACFGMLLLISATIKPTIMSGQEVPIIDREIFFGDPEISGGQISPDGKWLTFIKPYQDIRNIWIKRVDEDFEEARPITADTLRPIPGYFWSRDSKYILYVQDKGGNENYHVYAVDPFSKVMGENGVPPARNITDYEGVRAYIMNRPKSDPDLLYVGMNDRDPSWHDLYKVRISTGERELVYQNEDRISGFDFDHKDRIRLAARTKSDGSTEILRYNDGEFSPCYECSFEETCYVADFHKDNKRVYMVTNKGDRNLTELVLFNPETGEEEFVERDPENEVDFGGMFLSDVSKEIILTSYTGDKTRLYFKDEAYKKDYEWLKKELPGVEIGLGSHTKDEKKWLIYANSDIDPGAAYLFDRANRELTFQYRPRPNLPTEHLCEMIPVRYESSDGLEIPAYLTLPRGVEPKNLPVVMFIHGGPWARDYWGYDAYAQFLSNRGYAVLQPNFRSSTGFGKDFLNAGNGEWGELMQDDISTGVQYLIDEGIADPERVAIMGGSYGGYATLAGLTFTPDIYAAGVSLVGPSNLITLLESIPPYWEAGRVIMYKRMANPETEEGRAKLEKQSPLNSVDRIKAPLLVVQGANDPRVKQAESDQIVVAMREAGLPVEYLVAENEGHGFRNPDNQLAFAASAEKFLAEHIGGRYQKEVRPEIEETLEELTVDINTVKMPEKLSDDEMMQELPAPDYKVMPHEMKYNMNISMAGQQLTMQVDRVVEVMNDKVKLTTNVQSPMMNMKEELLLNEDMTPVSKAINQGPVAMNFDFKEDKVKALMNMNGQEKEMMTPLDNSVWDDNAGLYLALSQLKLEEGQERVLRVFDGQNNKVKNIKMKVIGMEDVEVPAGNFETYQVELKDVDEDSTKTVFVNADDEKRTVVKVNSTIKQMGGAKAVLELTSME